MKKEQIPFWLEKSVLYRSFNNDNSEIEFDFNIPYYPNVYKDEDFIKILKISHFFEIDTYPIQLYIYMFLNEQKMTNIFENIEETISKDFLETYKPTILKNKNLVLNDMLNKIRINLNDEEIKNYFYLFEAKNINCTIEINVIENYESMFKVINTYTNHKGDIELDTDDLFHIKQKEYIFKLKFNDEDENKTIGNKEYIFSFPEISSSINIIPDIFNIQKIKKSKEYLLNCDKNNGVKISNLCFFFDGEKYIVSIIKNYDFSPYKGDLNYEDYRYKYGDYEDYEKLQDINNILNTSEKINLINLHNDIYIYILLENYRENFILNKYNFDYFFDKLIFNAQKFVNQIKKKTFYINTMNVLYSSYEIIQEVEDEIVLLDEYSHKKEYKMIE